MTVLKELKKVVPRQGGVAYSVGFVGPVYCYTDRGRKWSDCVTGTIVKLFETRDGVVVQILTKGGRKVLRCL